LKEWQCHFLNVATAASITGQVRAKLWRAICDCDTPIYCDTDSIMCKGADFPISKELGEWKDEGTAHDLWIAGKKLYVARGDFGTDKRTGKRLKEKIASKGCKLTAKQIIDVVSGKTVTYHPDAPTYSMHHKPVFIDRNIKMT
jgi:hypothetical protein